MNERIKAKIFSITRIVLISLAGLVMLYFAITAAQNLYEKESILDEMRTAGVLTESKGMTIDATNLGTYFARNNIEHARELWKNQDPRNPLNDVRLFTPAYEAYMAEKAAAGELTKAQLSSYKTDGADLFQLMMLGFAYDNTDEYLERINECEEKFFSNCVYYLIALLVLLAFFSLLDKDKFNRFVPKGEKTTFGLPAYLSIVLCYLTLGLYGLLLFFYERKSRYVRQAAVQSMLIGMVTVAIVLCTTLMFTIFSYMFPPVAIIIYVIQLGLVGAALGLLGFALIMALVNRSVRLPIFGRLAINSSHCDVVG